RDSLVQREEVEGHAGARDAADVVAGRLSDAGPGEGRFRGADRQELATEVQRLDRGGVERAGEGEPLVERGSVGLSRAGDVLHDVVLGRVVQLHVVRAAGNAAEQRVTGRDAQGRDRHQVRENDGRGERDASVQAVERDALQALQVEVAVARVVDQAEGEGLAAVDTLLKVDEGAGRGAG